MTSITGDDLADLHQVADIHRCSWVTVHGLPQRYIVDTDARTLYVDGCLELDAYFRAVLAGLSELTGYHHPGNRNNVIPLQRRTRRHPTTVTG